MTAPADQPARDLAIEYDAAPEIDTPDSDHVLDDFPTESEPLSPADSPREVARKMIAAREVRKRQQVRKKTETAVDDGSTDASSPLPAQDSPLPAQPVAGALFDAASIDAPPLVPDAPPPVLDTPSPILLDALEDEAKESVETSTVEPALKPDPKPDFTPSPTSNPRSSNDEREDEMSQVAALRAVDLALSTREPSERVVAVDEFRAREARWPQAGPQLAARSRTDRARQD